MSLGCPGWVGWVFKKVDGSGCGGEGDGESACPICMDPLSHGRGLVKTLPCLHGFHADCVDKWLRTSNKCPLCNHCLETEHET